LDKLKDLFELEPIESYFSSDDSDYANYQSGNRSKFKNSQHSNEMEKKKKHKDRDSKNENIDENQGSDSEIILKKKLKKALKKSKDEKDKYFARAIKI